MWYFYGLYYQRPESNLVRSNAGCNFRFAVDLRPSFPARRFWVSALLDDVSHQQFWVPSSFAHSFWCSVPWLMFISAAATSIASRPYEASPGTPSIWRLPGQSYQPGRRFSPISD